MEKAANIILIYMYKLDFIRLNSDDFRNLKS